MNLIVATTSTAKEFFKELWKNYHESITFYGKTLLLIAVVFVLSWIISRIVCRVIAKGMKRINGFDESLIKILQSVARTFIWIFALLIILDLIGINTASILTVLGAVGLAVALAMKDSMSNIAAGLMLIVLRPYRTGDYVECGSVGGTIKEMGLFSTELKTVDGMFVAVPNSVIFGSPVKNYSRNPLRRGDIAVGIDYKNSLPEALKVLQQVLAECEDVLQDPAPEVLVDEFADSSVNLKIRFWAENAKYWNAYWQLKAAIKPALENANINIPFPQRVVTVINANKAE